jgi:predicted amidohydrolase YtcJ
MRIEACFDSHVHWQATGEFADRLQLHSLSSAEEVLNIRPEPRHFRGEWLLGFGWDETGWPNKPHRRILDRWFADKPVVLQRCDAHAMWLNSEALKRAGLLSSPRPVVPGGRLEQDEAGELSGVLVDQACELIHALIPQPTGFDVRRSLLKGVQVFNEAGFTHIRDMTCTEQQWNEAVRLDQSGLLTLAVEEYFWLRGENELQTILELYSRAVAERSPNLRAKGIKVFYDGALGSEGALLSRCYHGREHSGLRLWTSAQLGEILRTCWSQGAAVAVHAIGDAAAHEVVEAALLLKESGATGALHLEHAEILRVDTIAKMKGLEVECHMQPSHWLSDRRWLQNKIGDLIESAFPWRRLQEAEIKFDFGSDAPIEVPSLTRTFQALRESAEAGVPRLLGSPVSHMSHRDLAWAPNSFTLVEDEVPKQVVFRGEHLI